MSDNCVICGKALPAEGTHVCYECQHKRIEKLNALIEKLNVCAYGADEDCTMCVYYKEKYCAQKLAQDVITYLKGEDHE